jgi:aminobenzoyl-glutamate transport protein
VSGGFSANLIPSGIDPLLQGFTQSAAQIIDPARMVNPLSNWYFTAARRSDRAARLVPDRPGRRAAPEGTAVDGDTADMPKLEPLTPRAPRACRRASRRCSRLGSCC